MCEVSLAISIMDGAANSQHFLNYFTYHIVSLIIWKYVCSANKSVNCDIAGFLLLVLMIYINFFLCHIVLLE